MRIVEILALASATAFTLTIIYAYGFSLGVGVNLIKYFSINDYIRLSVYWLPKYIFFTALGYGYTKLDIPLSKVLSKSKMIQSSAKSAFVKFLFKYEILIFFVFFIGMTIAMIILTHSFTNPSLYGLYGLLAMYTWGYIARHILLHTYIIEWVKWKRQALVYIPIISILVFVYGAMSGQSGLASVDRHPTSQLVMITEEPIKNGKVLLALTQYIVFLDQKIKKVEIIPVGQVKDIIPIPKDKGEEEKNKKD